MTWDESVVREINALWLPVYPSMVEYVLQRSGMAGGAVLDLGPFAGGLGVELLARGASFRSCLLDRSVVVLGWARDQARQRGVASRLAVGRADPEALPAADAAFDLVLVRGAFFFLTVDLLREVRRVLRSGGFAWVGGGYGPLTPEAVIAPLADRSRLLNAAVGKRRVSPEELHAVVEAAGLASSARISEQGGLWVEVVP